MGDGIPVKVFVRARPFNDKERLENARECLQIFVESNQVSHFGLLPSSFSHSVSSLFRCQRTVLFGVIRLGGVTVSTTCFFACL